MASYVILDNFGLFVAQLANNGILLLSGLLPEDEIIILNEAKASGLQLDKKLQRGGWICMKFQISDI